MNKLIEDLLYKSGGMTNTYSSPDVDGFIISEDQINLFVESIVNECSNIADKEALDYKNARKESWDFNEKNIYAEGEFACYSIKSKINRKFGVK